LRLIRVTGFGLERIFSRSACSSKGMGSDIGSVPEQASQRRAPLVA
jgi:hypothetical protein